MPIDDRPTIAAPDDDPWLWLEEIEGPRALDFVERQNRLTLEKFGGVAFERDRDLLAASYDRPDNIPMSADAEVICTISGRTPAIRAVCGDEPRLRSFASPIRLGRSCWISTSLRLTKARTGC